MLLPLVGFEIAKMHNSTYLIEYSEGPLWMESLLEDGNAMVGLLVLWYHVDDEMLMIKQTLCLIKC